MGIKKSIYNISPYFMQKTFFDRHCLSLHKVRFNENFFEQIEQLNQSQWLMESDLVELQSLRLRRIVSHAYETVPYYNRVMKERNLKPKDIKTVDDLPKLPLLTRDDVRKNKHDLISTQFSRKQLHAGHTSGTTGSPLDLYWNGELWFMNNVFDWRQKYWAGLQYGKPYGVVLGQPIVSLDRKKPPYWQYNRHDNQLWLSAFHLSQATIPYYLEQLRSNAIVALEGYPSTLYVLARLLINAGETYPLSMTFTSSETLYDYQLEAMAEAFECENYDFYGQAERVIWATECDQHGGKHLNLEYGVTEIVDDTGSVLPRGESGFMVGTSLLNLGMPFIRYKTSDISSILNRRCECGRELPLMDDVTTKAEDLILTPSGKYISSSALTHPFKPLHNIEMSQIIQEEIDLITIKIVKRPGYTDEDTRTLLRSFIGRVGQDVHVRVEFADDIPREKSGKFKWVVSRLSQDTLH